jgi:twitching motility protein PilT
MQVPLPDTIVPLLEKMGEIGASDLHLKTGIPPVYRVGGDLRRTTLATVKNNGREIEKLMEPIMPPERKHLYHEKGGLDFAYLLPNGDRFRINVLRSCDQMHAAIRRVKAEIPGFEELHLPPIYRKLTEETNEGIIIVCGVTGCGKSTTQAAMIDYINGREAVNIVSIEDPIEYAFPPKKAIVSQREIGLDVITFAEALRGAVRQDPDIIFIGETRDRDTLLAALQAAETGHLVFCTLHTADSMQALGRILEFFPPDQHAFIRSSLANSLKAICAQRLVPAINEEISRVPATEVLLGDAVVKDKIREGEDTDLPEIISGSKESGMRNFTMSLAELIDQGMIYTDVAMEYAPNREALKSQLAGIKSSAQTLVSRVKRSGNN